MDDGALQLQQVIRNEGSLFQSSVLGDDMFEKTFQHGIDEVYTNPWFRRMWIVQEVCLAPKAIILHRGREMDWQEFAIAMTVLWTSIREQVRDIPARASFERAYELVRVARLFRAAMSSERTAEQQLRSVSRLSHMLRGQQCKFDQDRIYALMSLQPEGSPLSSIVPDYTLPVLQVFRDFARPLALLGHARDTL